jgi:3',5'-cyclic AMP phosphodiesterase CpdA
VGAGDIADCKALWPAAKTANLLEHIEGTVFTLGDHAYENGTPEQFADCYGPTWGRHKARTRPVVGNHDYGTSGAAGYFEYFGVAAGDPKKGYYSYDLGTWHIVVLNSNCGEIGGCKTGSLQEKWLREDLAAHPALCTAAMWHHPRFSSAEHGDDDRTRDLWKALAENGAELVMSGHDHDYERFAPQDADGRRDSDHGVRQFVAGTGGRHEYKWNKLHANSEARNNDTFGVLRLTLHPDGYDWQFVPVEGRTFTDSGSVKCH